MQIKIEKQKLLNGLNTSIKAISNKSTLEILSGFLLIAKNNELKIIGNDLNLGIETTIKDVTIFKEGSVVIKAKLFIDMIKKLPDYPVSLIYKENQLIIKCQEIEFDIMGNNPEEYPELPDIKKENEYTFNSDLMKTMIKQTIFATSTDEARPILNGVLFEIEDNILKLVAVDGYRLAHKTAKVNKTINNRAVIPSKTLKELIKILEDNDTFRIYFSDKHIVFNINNVKIISRLLEGDFIDYKGILPDEFISQMEVDTQKLKSSIERGLLLAMKNNKSSIKFEIENNKLFIESNAETGKLSETLNVKYKGEKLIIGFNPNYLLDVLKIIDSEKIIMKFNNKISPTILKGKKDDNYKYMILPVRLS